MSDTLEPAGELLDRYRANAGYNRRSYFFGTLRDELKRLPAITFDTTTRPQEIDPDTRIARSSIGDDAVALGGILLKRIVIPSKTLSMAHIYGQSFNRTNGSDAEQGHSWHWRTFKVIEELLQAPQSLKRLEQVFAELGMPTTRNGVKNILSRLGRTGLTTVLERPPVRGVDPRNKFWALTAEGHSALSSLVQSVTEISNRDAEIHREGTGVMQELAQPGTKLPHLIKRAKKAYGSEQRRLHEVNEALTELAKDSDGTATVTVAEIQRLLGDEQISHTLLSRLHEQLPGSALRSVRSPRGRSNESVWEVVYRTPSSHYRALGQKRT